MKDRLRFPAFALLVASMLPPSLSALDRAMLGGLPTITVDGVSCTLSDAIRAANDATTVGGCSGAAGLDVLSLEADVVMTTAETTHSSLVGGGHAGLPDVTSGIVIVAGAGSTIERDAALPCEPQEATAFRIFNVTSTGALYLFDLTLRNGCVAPANGVVAEGGALHLEGGLLELAGVTLEGHRARGFEAESRGGAFHCRGGEIPSIANSAFTANAALGTDGQVSASHAAGGAGRLENCTLGSLRDSVFETNSAVGSSDNDGSARGGALDIQSSTLLQISGVDFLGNLAEGGSTTTTGGSTASGGGVSSSSSAIGTIVGCTFLDNTALGGTSTVSSGNRGDGGAIRLASSTTVDEIGASLFANNVAEGGDSGGTSSPGDADGGAISLSSNTTITLLRDSWLHGNSSQGGEKTGQGGGVTARGGALGVGGSIGSIERSTFSENLALGGAASFAQALGGAIQAGGTIDLVVNSSFYGNLAVGGTDNDPGEPGGSGRGGALYLAATPNELRANTFSGNEAQGGTGAAGSGDAQGGALYLGDPDSVNAVGNLFDDNRVLTDLGVALAQDCWDESFDLTSGGWNLLEAAGNCVFAAAGDQVGVTTATYAPADWGCATTLPDGTCVPTVAIDQASLAADAGSCTAASIAADARETPRPFDLPAIADADDGCDIGAFEAVDGDGDGFTEAADCAQADPLVWAVDACGVCDGDDSTCSIFADGFESGDLTAWSSSAP